MIVKRSLGPVTALLAGEWTDQTVSGRPAVSCPQCETIEEVDVLEPGGRAVLACRRCGVLGPVVLADYQEEVLR